MCGIPHANQASYLDGAASKIMSRLEEKGLAQRQAMRKLAKHHKLVQMPTA
jgi:hypothetical protein